MARKIVKFLACDRCPVTRKTPATRSETISIGDSHWSLDLCEICGRKLDMEIWSWGRLGKEVDARGSQAAIRLITEDSKFEARRAAELRSQQKDAVSTARSAAVEAPQPARAGLSPSAAKWRFTNHALERLQEREVGVIEALQACTKPSVRRAGDRPGVSVQETGGVQVVVNDATKEILTVARKDREARKAI